MNETRGKRLIRSPYPFPTTTQYGETLSTRTEVHKYKKHLPKTPDLTYFLNFSKQLPEINQKVTDEIKNDVKRTIIRNSENKIDLENRLIHILLCIGHAHGNYLPQVLHLAASLLFVSNNEEMTFGVILELIKILDDYFTDNMIGVQADVELLRKLLSFDHPSISVISETGPILWRWLLGCFASDLPLYTFIEAIQLVLLKGKSVLVSLCHGLMERTIMYEDLDIIKYYPFTIFRFGKVAEIMSTHQIVDYPILHQQEVERIKTNQSFSLRFKMQSSIENLIKGIKNILSINESESQVIVKGCNNFQEKPCQILEKHFSSCQKLYKFFGGTRNEMKHLHLFSLIVWGMTDSIEIRCKIVYENLNRLQKDSLMFADLETGLKRLNEYLKNERKDESCIDVRQLRVKYPIQNVTIKMLNLMCRNELKILIEDSSLGIGEKELKQKLFEIYNSL